MSNKLKAVLAAVAVIGGLFTYSSIAEAGSDNVTSVANPTCRGGVQKAVTVVTDSSPRTRGPGGWVNIPGAALAQNIVGADDLVIITLSAETTLTNVSVGHFVEVRLLVDGNPMLVRPVGPNTFLEAAAGRIAVQNSATWCVRLAQGPHQLQAQWNFPGGAGSTATIDDSAFHVEVSE